MFCSREWSLSASVCAAAVCMHVCVCVGGFQGSEDLEDGDVFLSLAVEHLATSRYTRKWSLIPLRSRTGNIVLAPMT